MVHMIAVIIAGGSGTRLWPLSTPEYPKHLLSLTNEKSLLQNTLARVSQLTTEDKILIVPESSHLRHVEEQLKEHKDVTITAEPSRRGTAHCLLFALLELEKKNVDPEEPVAILWADHLIRDESGFVSTFQRASKIAEKYKKVVFVGAEPVYPSTGFGYMEHNGVQQDNVYELISFHEKPDKEKAKEYYSSGKYFWNMGYLVMSINTFKKQAQEFAPELWSTFLALRNAPSAEELYMTLKNIPLEYEFSEKLKGALVIPGSFDWVDIGSFGDLHSISSQDEKGNHVRGALVELEGVTNSYVRNDEEKPVAVIGLDNVVVINSPNGILVTNKNFAQKVGDVSKRLS